MCFKNTFGKINKTIIKLTNQTKKKMSISIDGGVSKNKYITKKFEDFFENRGIEIFFPTKEMMSDNAAMIAWNCINKNINYSKDINFKANPRMTIR